MNLNRISSIKQRFRLAFFSLVILSAIGGYFSYHLLVKVSNYQQTQNKITEINTLLTEAQKAERDFMLFERKQIGFLEEATSPAIILHRENTAKIIEFIEKMKEDKIINDLELQDEMHDLTFPIAKYRETFDELVKAYHERGFKDHGLEGSMRNYVHQLQKGISPEEKVFAFSLRRHEKDFMLRKDMKYIEKLHNTANEFKKYLIEASGNHFSEEYKANYIKTINSYTGQFDKLVELENKIGLTDDKGIRGKLNAKVAAFKPEINFLQTVISDQSNNVQANSTVILIATITIIFIVGLILSFGFTNMITKPIILLSEVAKAGLKGNKKLETELEGISRKDEIGSLAYNFKKLLNELRENIDIINQKNEKLEKTALEDQKRTWAIEGLTMFTDIMKSGENLKDLSYELISKLVKYTKSNQGGLFILEKKQA